MMMTCRIQCIICRVMIGAMIMWFLKNGIFREEVDSVKIG